MIKNVVPVDQNFSFVENLKTEPEKLTIFNIKIGVLFLNYSNIFTKDFIINVWILNATRKIFTNFF